MARGGPWAVEGAGACGVAGRPARSPALAPLRHAPGGCRRHLRTARNRGLRLRSRPGLLTPLSHHVLRLDHGWLALGGADGARPRELRDPTSKGTLAWYRRGRDSAWASGPYVPDLRGDPGPLPVRRRGARGRHGGPDLRRVRPSRILRAGHRNGPRTPSLAHRPLAPQGREPRPRASIQSACRDNGSLALRRRYLRAATDVPLPARVRADRATPLHNHIYGVDLRRPALVRPHRAARRARPLRVRCPTR